MRRLDEAITTCQDAAAIYRETGDRHGDLGRSEQAAGVYEQVVARFGDDTERAVRERVAMARQMKAEINRD